MNKTRKLFFYLIIVVIVIGFIEGVSFIILTAYNTDEYNKRINV